MSHPTQQRPVTPDPNSQLEADFSELVEKTRGVQPWRRFFHAAGGVLIVLSLQLLPIGRWTALVLLGSILTVLVLLDIIRLASPRWNRNFFRAFSSLASPREAGKIASSTWYLLGAFLTLLFFPRPYALAGILVLALADPAASVVGRVWGKRPFGAGTLEGTAVFVGVAVLAILPFAPWWAALPAAVVTAVVERTSWRLDDNITVPLTVAAALLLLTL